MPDSCVVVGCTSGYKSNPKKVPLYYFPLNNDKRKHLVEHWKTFVNRGGNLKLTQYSAICANHFEEYYLEKGKKRTILQWHLDPIPTIYDLEEKPSLKATQTILRKPPRDRSTQPCQQKQFNDEDLIKNFDQLDDKLCPENFIFKKFDDHVVYYSFEFVNNKLPRVGDTIHIDKNMNVELYHFENRVPLPLWFVQGKDAKLKRKSQFLNMVSYLKTKLKMTFILK
jgi:hypothetical protein